MLITADHLVTAVLVYLLCGALVWCALFGAGIVSDVTRARIAQGEAPSALALLIATIFVILKWPAFVVGFVRSAPR